MPISTTAGSKFYIGSTAAADTALSFAADTYVSVANITDMGEAGPEAEIVTGKYVDKTYVHKLKGTRDNGTLTLVVDRAPEDPGQTALRLAEKSNYPFNFKIELNDGPVGGTNTIFYFKAIISSAKTTMSGPDDTVKETYALAITGEIIPVPATAPAPVPGP